MKYVIRFDWIVSGEEGRFVKFARNITEDGHWSDATHISGAQRLNKCQTDQILSMHYNHSYKRTVLQVEK